MDLIAREQPVSSLKNHNVRRLFLNSSLDPQGSAVGGILERLENTNVNIAFSFFLCSVYDSLSIHCETAYSSSDSMCKIACADWLYVSRVSTEDAHNVS